MAENRGELLIVTNGDSAVGHLKESGFGSAFLPWRDVLHDGPVPDLPTQQLSEIRALFISSQEWAPFEETRRALADRDQQLLACNGFDKLVLWFEHDLYDQLQLLQVIHLLSQTQSRPQVSTVLCQPHITSFSKAETRDLFDSRRPLEKEQQQTGVRLWTAFTQGDLPALEAVATGKDTPFPHLREALRRWFEEFPSVETGLTRTEEQIVSRLEEDDDLDPVKLFKQTQQREEAAFLGDASFWSYLEDMDARGVIGSNDGSPFLPPWNVDDRSDFRRQKLTLPVSTRKALKESQPAFGPGAEPHYSCWRGGCLITSQNPVWWDPQKARLVTRLL